MRALEKGFAMCARRGKGLRCARVGERVCDVRVERVYVGEKMCGAREVAFRVCGVERRKGGWHLVIVQGL